MKTLSFRLAAFTALSIVLPLVSGCPAPDPAASPVADASSVAESPAVTESPAAMGPPPPPPGPKPAGAFDTRPFKSSGKVVKTASGLQYDDMTVGKGALAAPGKTCVMHYTGTLTNGTKFDSSRDRGEPFPFTLGAGQVIKGWDEGVAGMRVGGRRKLTIPSSLGYGANGTGPIPGNATLVFDVELMDVR